MSINLSQADFKRLVSIISNFPEFDTVRSRRSLIANAFEGYAVKNSILSRLDLEGTPMLTASEALRFLITFGTVAPGVEPLGIFLDNLLVNIGGGDDADFMSDLITHHSLYSVKNNLSSAITFKPSPVSSVSDHYIFLSYAHADIVFATQLELFLIGTGFKVFRDNSGIRSGSNWDMEIERALNETDRMVLLLSTSSMPYRKEVHREWFYFDQKGKRIHPLYLQKCILHSRMLAYNYINVTQDLPKGLKTLVDDLLS